MCTRVCARARMTRPAPRHRTSTCTHAHSQRMEGGNLHDRIYDRLRRRLSYLEILQACMHGPACMGLHASACMHV